MTAKNPMDLSGRKILITGASSGIGRAAAVLLDSLGAETVLVGRNEQRLAETADKLINSHLCIPFDLLDFDGYDKLFSKAVADGEKLNGLVHCAGDTGLIPLRVMSVEKLHRIMDINFTSFMMLSSFYSKKKYSSGGSIVAMSSISSQIPQKCLSIYSASKSAIEAAVKTLSLELSSLGIRINCIAAGFVDTPVKKKLVEENIEKILNNQLLGMIRPDQIASVIAFLLSEASSVITGRTIFADGGMLGQIAD